MLLLRHEPLVVLTFSMLSGLALVLLLLAVLALQEGRFSYHAHVCNGHPDYNNLLQLSATAPGKQL